MPLLPRDIKEFLAPFKQLINRNALAPVYRCLALHPAYVRGCSAYGIMEAQMQLGLSAAIYVDALTFIGIVESLPPDEELILDTADGALLWGCGKAKGRLALLSVDNMPALPAARPDAPQWQPSKDFSGALRKGAVSCNSASLASTGMHGVVLDSRSGLLLVTSSDNITVSACMVEVDIGDDHPLARMPRLVTISPDACALLSSVVSPAGKLEMDATSVIYREEGLALVLKQVDPLKHDLLALLDNYAEAEITAPIPPERIAAFVKRVTALSENKKNLSVALHAQNGQIALAFSEAVAMSDEYFLVDGLKVEGEMQIHLDASRLARALSDVDTIVLDYMKRGAVLFRGDGGAFQYLVGGRQ
jgi:DNA polymerase III sliding clamp (beta) subunit (PCNA family)